MKNINHEPSQTRTCGTRTNNRKTANKKFVSVSVVRGKKYIYLIRPIRVIRGRTLVRNFLEEED